VRLKLLAIVVLLVVAGAAVFASVGGLGPPATAATTLLTATAAVADVTDEIAATGSVEATSQYALAFGSAPVASDGGASASDASSPSGAAASVTWPVTEVKVAVGDRVTKGQALAVANASDLDAQIADATRTAEIAGLQLRQATLDRAAATTDATRRQTQIGIYNAQTAAARASAELVALEALKHYVTLTAPADGIVSAVAVRPGVDAPSGSAITMISSDLRVTTSVVESDVAAIKVGQAATVSVGALEASLQGTVTSIVPVGAETGSNGVVAFSVDVKLDTPPAGLRPGMSADVTIVAASATGVLSVPSRALSGEAGAYTVRVVAADGSVTSRPVGVGLVTASLAQITSGLQAGERVVTGTSSSQTQSTTVGGQGGGAFPGGGIIRQGTRP
jgi:HlyD family secretion protein